MNAKTRPGLAIYSDEWMSEVATNVPEPLRPIVRAICETYQLGDSTDPNSLAQIIERELSAQCRQWEHQIRNEQGEDDETDLLWVRPDGLEYDAISGYFYYICGSRYYMPEEILARRKP